MSSSPAGAYEQIVGAYQEMVWRNIARLLYDREATKDLVQETFVKAYLALATYSTGTSFDAWLRTIARNLARNRLRDSARAAARLEAYREYALAQSDDRIDETASCRSSALAECIGELPESTERLVKLHYEESMPLADVAKKMGRSVEATRQALWRVRVALRDCVRKRLAAT